MSAPKAQVGVRPEFGIRRRSCRLVAGIIRPFQGSFRTMFVGFGAGATVALVAAGLRHSPVVGAAIGLAVGTAAFLVALRPFANPDLRGALELINDHNCHERAEWRAEIGGRIPAGIGPQERWLAAHPTGPGRATVLLALGRLDEADVAIDEMVSKSPEERFGVEILRKTRELLASQRPDLGPLQSSWRELPDPRERRNRRQCLALLEAQVAVADHEDPIPTIATARREIGEVHPSMRIERLFARWALVGAVAIVLAAVVGSTIS